MNTANGGSPDDQDERQGMPWGWLALGILALALAALIGPPVIGVLFALMVPPEPPVPEGARLLNYTSEAYGADTWTYDTDQDVCQLGQFFQQQGGQCPVLPSRCAADGTQSQSEDYIAQCYGDIEFSIFALRWQFEIPVRTIQRQRTEFSLSREVFWTGDLPPEAP